MAGRRGFSPRAGKFRLAIAFVTLLAFIAQTIITQTHIHAAAHAGNASTLSLAANPHSPLPDKSPPGDEQANCPICQGLLHAGAYVTPVVTAVTLLNVATFVSFVTINVTTIGQAQSHAWKSRAPPAA